MTAFQSVVIELEDAIANGTSQKRVQALRAITDLFVTGSRRFSDEQIELFDQVIVRLADEIEARARAELAERLADIPNAPVAVIRNLAEDDIIDVSGPVLTHSSRLDDQALVGIAQKKSQHHLLAISQRDSISEVVTDVLVVRGDQQVLRSVAQNAGARFSDTGFGVLVDRSRGDDALTTYLGMRKDVPRHHLGKLIEKASDAARRKLAAANPVAAAEVRRVLAEVAARLEAEVAAPPRDYTAAKELVAEMRRLSKFGETEIRVFAQSGKFEETVVCMSILCGLPLEAVEGIFENDKSDMCLVLARAAGLSWPTAKLILLMQSAGGGLSGQDLECAKDNFDKLQPAKAQRVVRFYKVRQTAGQS